MISPGQSLPRWKNLLEIAILITALIISVAIILQGDGVVPKPNMDQHFVQTVNLQLRRDGGSFVFQYPNLMHAGGITSSVIAGLYKLIIPTTYATLNWHFKIFSMACHLISSFFLLRIAIPTKFFSLRILAFLVIATSGFQLIEPSSDVLSAALLNLFFIAVLKGWPRLIPAFVLATFGLCKVELTLAAVALSLFWAVFEWIQGRSKPYIVALMTWGFLALYVAPAFVFSGSNFLQSDRGSTAFFSAYADYMRLHQFQVPTPSPTEAGVAMQNTVFRDAPTFRDVVSKHPDLYFDFLGVSAARSIPNVVKVIKFTFIPLILVLFNFKKIRQNYFLFFGAILVAACILLPSWLVIFVRMRYLAKVVPILTAGVFASSIELSANRKIYLPVLWISGIATIVWQALALTPYQD